MMTGGQNLFLNDRIVAAEEASISALDRSFLYGEGFFETTRVYNGTAFLLSAHLERLRDACEWAEWEHVPGRERMKRGIERLIDANNVRDGYLRITLSAGRSGRPTLLVQAHDMQLAPPGAGEPIILVKAEWARAERDPVVARKSLSYHGNVRARRQAAEKNADEVYFLNHAGNLAEGAISNLFFVRDGRLHTPAPSCGLLPGIARRTVLQLCERQDIPLRQGSFPESALKDCDEAFCTNSLRGIMPVSGIRNGPDFRSAPGELTSRVRDLYGQKLRSACAAD